MTNCSLTKDAISQVCSDFKTDRASIFQHKKVISIVKCLDEKFRYIFKRERQDGLWSNMFKKQIFI